MRIVTGAGYHSVVVSSPRLICVTQSVRSTGVEKHKWQNKRAAGLDGIGVCLCVQ